jgi:translocation and assembly module TamB
VRRALSLAGLGALGLAALAGLALSAAFLLATTEAGRSLLLPRLLALADRELAGHLELDGFSAGATGALEVRGLRLLDPEGRLVISLERARGQVDLSRLRSRRVSLRLEVEGVRLALAREPGGPWNLERALAPARPPERPEPPSGPFAWTVRLARLSVSRGEIEVREGAELRLRAALGLEARAVYGPRGGRGELRLDGRVLAPVERPVSLALAAAMAGKRVSVPHLRAALGDTALELAAEGVPEARQGRAALLALAVKGEDASRLAPGARLGDLTARAYAESDGAVATAAFQARPAGGGGTAEASAALRLPPAELAAGIDLRLEGFDPSRAAGFLPPGDLRVSARGHAAGGTDWRRIRGALALSAAASRLRGGRFGPAEIAAQARDGTFEISRLEAALPGASLSARGSWRPRGALSGRLEAEAGDLGLLARNLSSLSGERLPRLSGSGRIRASLSGTAEEPGARVELAAPRLEVESAGAQGVALDLEVALRKADPLLRLEARAARLLAGGLEGRGLLARARMAGLDAEARVSLLVPRAGPDPFALRAGGRFAPDRRSLALSELEVAWPGTRFALAAPARLELAGPRVDRLDLRSGPQRLAVEGGLARGALEIRASGEALDLERIPAALLPEDLGLRGRLSFSAEARGRPAAPRASAHLEASGLAARGLEGIQAAADLRLDGPADRAGGALSIRGLAGGSVEASAELPLHPRRARPSEPLALRAEVSGLDLAPVLRAARADLPLEGRLSLRGELRGTLADPALEASALVEQGRWGPDASGRLDASARLGGSLSAPRGSLQIALSDGAVAGWRSLGLEAALDAGAGSTGLALRASAGGSEVLSARGAVSLPPERLRDRAALERAPLRLSAEASGLDLARIAGPVQLAGAVDLRARLGGRAAAPELELEVRGRSLAVEGRPLGDLSAGGRAAGREVAAQASLGVAGGGRAQASFQAAAEVSLEALEKGSWRRAPAQARFEAQGLDLGILAAAAPGAFRSASGRLDAALQASGPLADLRPTGTLRVADGRASVVGAGEWHGIELQADLGEDRVELKRLAARRGDGSLEATASASGLRGPDPAELRGELRASRLTVSQYGQDVATLDLSAQLRGTASARALSVELTIPSGTAVLPDRSLRALQSLEPREDIVLQGRGRPRAAASAGPPYRAAVQLLLPGRFLVKRRDPRVEAELRGDLTFVAQGGEVTAEGRADLVRGSLDLYGNGRTFDLRRASTTFSGGPVGQGTIDGEAVAQFPDHVVKVTLGGTVDAPKVKLASEPPLDEGRIAMLIATGRTEGRAGAGAAGSLTGEQAGYAVLGVFATKLLRDALQDKLPVDSVALEPGQIRAGKYLSDKVYLDYVHRSSANPEQGENANEVRVEYQVTRRWTLESRYGDANAGSASFIWSKDY